MVTVGVVQVNSAQSEYAARLNCGVEHVHFVQLILKRHIGWEQL